MKNKILTSLLLFTLALFTIQPLRAQFGQPPADAKEISAEEAAKSYPPPRGGYPSGDLTEASGVIKSPYPPHRQFKTHTWGKDGKEVTVKRGALILDPFAKKVFVNP